MSTGAAMVRAGGGAAGVASFRGGVAALYAPGGGPPAASSRPGTVPAMRAWLVAGVLLLIAGAAVAQRVEVVVDPPILSLGETLSVSFSYSGDSAGVEPDFSPLTEGFEVLRTNMRDTLQIIGGRTTQTKVWNLTLVPREEGTVEIPPIQFGSVRSPSRSITVTAARDATPGEADVFIELAVDPPGEVYVQSQVLLTVRLFLDTSVRVSNATLSEPESAAGDLVVESVAEQRGQEKIGERTYQVFEQRYALFPQRSGELELDPIVFSADMRSYFERPAYRRVQSDPITLQVRSAARAGADPWLPARAVTLTQEFPQADGQGVIEARVGEPVTRSVTMSALGLTAAQLPPVEVSAPEDFKIYRDQPSLDQRIIDGGILGERVERLSMLPTRPGTFTLPPVEMTWWDVAADRPRTARLEAVTLRVQPPAGTPEAPLAGGDAGLPAPQAGVGAAASAAAGTARSAPGAAGPVTTSPGLWPWLALFLGLGWLTTGGLWWRHTYGAAPAVPVARGDGGRQRLGDALTALRTACERGDVTATRQALLDWARLRWRRETVTDLITVRRLGGPALAAQLDRLDASRYAPETANWDGRALVTVVEELTAQVDGDAEHAGGGELEPLYR